MRKTKEQKAITLIALIITIVVLLILAMVAINAVTGDGIIQHATNAKTEYEKAQEEEQDVLAYYEQYLKTEGKSGDWIQNKTIVKNVKTGQTIEVGEKINYIATDSDYESGEWAILGVENGNILLVSRNLPTSVTLESHTTAISELNDRCKSYDEGEYAIKGSARSINVDDINRVTGYNPLKTGNGEVYNKGKLNQYANKVTYTMNEDGTIINYVLEFAPEGIAKVGQLPKSVTKCIDIAGIRLVKESEKGAAGTVTSITIPITYYGYYPTSLTFDEKNTTVNGISKDSKAYKFLFLNSDSSKTNYSLASLFTLQYSIQINGAFYGLAEYGVRYIGYDDKEEMCVGRGKILGDSIGTNYGRVEEKNVRAVITLESDVQLTKQSDGSYNID